MLTPAATAAVIASWPLWKYVPSPRFWMKWSRSTNGAMPIHCVPSLPMQVMPGDVADPLGVHQQRHRVAADAGADERTVGHLGGDRLCGHPEQ